MHLILTAPICDCRCRPPTPEGSSRFALGVKGACDSRDLCTYQQCTAYDWSQGSDVQGYSWTSSEHGSILKLGRHSRQQLMLCPTNRCQTLTDAQRTHGACTTPSHPSHNRQSTASTTHLCGHDSAMCSPVRGHCMQLEGHLKMMTSTRVSPALNKHHQGTGEEMGFGRGGGWARA